MPVGTAVTFRIYPLDDQNSAQDDCTVDNLTVNGTILVPEPSSWATVGLGEIGAVWLAARRRRRLA